MRRFMTLITILIIALVDIGTNAQTPSATIIDQLNIARTNDGRAALISDPTLTAIAEDRFDTIAERGSAIHQPEDTEELQALADAHALTAAELGENVGIGIEDPMTLVNAWLGSTTHRQNVIDPVFQAVGIASGTVLLEDGPTYVAVAVFAGTSSASPASAAETSSRGWVLPLLAAIAFLAIVVAVTTRRGARPPR